MTKTDQEALLVWGEMLCIKMRATDDGALIYGNTKTYDAQRASHDLMALRGSK